MKAFAIGLAGVFLFMLLYYCLSGLVADIVLLLLYPAAAGGDEGHKTQH